jgi:sporulation protein YlmC with PRC-barrel domain
VGPAVRSLCAAACLALASAVAAQPVVVAPATGESAGTTPMEVARFTQLEDLALRDARGAKAGEFEDVVFELQSGRILHAVISVDRGWGKAEAEFAVPLRDLGVHRLPPGERPATRLVLSVPPHTLPPASKPADGSPYASGEALLDDAIRNPSGELVAEVKDVLIDFRAAHVRHLLVQSAKDPQDRLFLVELARLQRPEGSPHLVFNGTAEQLAASPSIPKARLDDTDFATLR